jgi:hypothetical protein
MATQQNTTELIQLLNKPLKINEDSYKLYKQCADSTKLTVYKNRVFGNEFEIELGYECIINYKHIKKLSNNYLVLDIDSIDNEKWGMLLNSAHFEPNFYIKEFSKNKQQYTIQAFILLDSAYTPTDSFITKYKQLCYLFNADMYYQIKVGIHKIPFSDKTTYIHNRKINFNANFEELEQLGFITDISTIKQENLVVKEQLKNITVKVAAARDVKKVVKNNKQTGLRNVTLFDRTREIAYRVSDKSYDNILHIAKSINAKFITPLKIVEVKKIAKSIFQFVAKNFTNIKVDPYSDIQRAKSIDTRISNTLEITAKAILELKKENKELTITAVKKLTKQNHQTVKKHFEQAKIVALELFNAEQIKKIGPAKTPKITLPQNTYYADNSDIEVNSPSLIFGKNVPQKVIPKKIDHGIIFTHPNLLKFNK